MSLFLKIPIIISQPNQVKEQINNLVNNYKKNNIDTNPNEKYLIRNNNKIIKNLEKSLISPKIKKEMSQIIHSQLSNPVKTNSFYKEYKTNQNCQASSSKSNYRSNETETSESFNDSYYKNNNHSKTQIINSLNNFNKYDICYRSDI